MRVGLGRVLVQGLSMAPTLRPGDQLLVRRNGTPSVGSIVVVALPQRPLAVKRLVARASDGSVWVEGDNALGSTDSRTLGALPATSLEGVVLARLWPRPRLLRAPREGPPNRQRWGKK